MTVRKFGLLSSSLVYGLGGAAQRCISLLLLPLFTRYLTPTDYGVVGLLAVLPALLLPIFSLGLTASISVCYFSLKYAEKRQSVIQTSLWITYYSVAIMMMLTFIDLDWITQLSTSNLEYRSHTLVAIITAAISIICLPLQLELQFSGRPLEFVISSLVSAIVASLCSVILVVWFNLSSLGILTGSMLGQISLWILLLLRRHTKSPDIKGSANFQIAKELLKHGLPLLPSFMFLFLLQNGVRWSLESKHGVEAVGLYAIGTNFGSVLTLITSGFVTAWMPWAMQLSDQWSDARHMVAKRLTQYVICVGFLVLLFFCFAQPVLYILTPQVYFDAWTVVGLAATANFMISLFSLVLPPIYMAGKVNLVLISQGVAAVVAIVSAHFLLDFGIFGASLAVALGTFTMIAVQLIINKKLVDVPTIPLEFKKIFFIGLIFISSCGITFFLKIEHIGKFAIASLLLILLSGFLMFTFFPDKKSLYKKFQKNI
tara:strand:- start:370160 stop:371614 length:1455 start_codon:yes stop_codon:yes gene_type:complete